MNSIPDTDVLVLVCQLLAHPCIVVVSPNQLGIISKEVLCAALRGQVVIVTGILGNLEIFCRQR